MEKKNLYCFLSVHNDSKYIPLSSSPPPKLKQICTKKKGVKRQKDKKNKCKEKKDKEKENNLLTWNVS